MRNSRINWIFLWRLPIQNHSKLCITEKKRSKAKYLTWNSIRPKFLKNFPSFQTLSKALDVSSAAALEILFWNVKWSGIVDHEFWNTCIRCFIFYKFMLLWHLQMIFLTGIPFMQGWAATTRNGVIRQRGMKILRYAVNFFRKNLQLIGVS